LGDSQYVYKNLRVHARSDFERFVAQGLHEGETIKRIADLANISRHEVRDAAKAMWSRRLSSSPPFEAGDLVVVRTLAGDASGVVLRRTVLADLLVRNITRSKLQRRWYLIQYPGEREGIALHESLTRLSDGRDGTG
jgi:hypothetical protein